MVEEEVYYPPDTTAQIFWLKNRKPEEWREKREVDFRSDAKSKSYAEVVEEAYKRRVQQ